MTSPRLIRSQAINYQLNKNARIPHRNQSWEVLTYEWDLITVASKNFSPCVVLEVSQAIAQYNTVMVIGVAHGELFKNTGSQIFGVDRSAEIHSVAGANARARGTGYTRVRIDYLESHTVDCVVVDCAPSFLNVVEYVLAHHQGPTIALHKSQQVLEQIAPGNRSFTMIKASGEPLASHWRPNGPQLPSVQHLGKVHSIANIGPDLAGINNTTHRK